MSATNRTTEKMDGSGMDRAGPCVEPKARGRRQRSIPTARDTANDEAREDDHGKLERN